MKKIKLFGYGIGIGGLTGAALSVTGLMVVWFGAAAIAVFACAWADIEKSKKGA